VYQLRNECFFSFRNLFGYGVNLINEVAVPRQIGNPEACLSRLSGSKEFAGSSKGEVFLRN
jgi:hypothetical protein